MEDLSKALEMKDDSVAAQALEAHAGSEPPLFEEFYVDWAAFDLAVASAIERHHPIRKRSSLTFEVYNRTVSKGRHDRKPIAEFLSKTFKCTHGIKFRSRGTGKRSRHKLRDIGCPFHIYATAIEDGNGYRVKVRTHDKHNHQIGPDASKNIGTLHDSDYEYTDSQASAIRDAAAAIVESAAVSSPPSDGDLQLHMSSYSHAAAQLHHHASLHDHANAADILGTSEEHDSESLLEGAIDTHLGDFSTAAEAVAAAAAAVAATIPETDTAPARSAATPSRFEATATLEDLRRKLSEFADDRDWDQFHSPRNLVLALAGEIGELCECFQWKGDNKPIEEWTAEERVHLGEEISDVMMYVIRLADKCQIDLPTAILDKMEKNARRFPADAVRGSAKKFNEFKRQRLDREASL